MMIAAGRSSWKYIWLTAVLFVSAGALAWTILITSRDYSFIELITPTVTLALAVGIPGLAGTMIIRERNGRLSPQRAALAATLAVCFWVPVAFYLGVLGTCGLVPQCDL